MTILPILISARILHCYAFLPRFDPIGVFCNVKPELDPRGFTAPNVVGKAGVLPKRPLLVVVNAPKAPTGYSHFNTLTLLQSPANIITLNLQEKLTITVVYNLQT